jgi:hypothetical protein
MCGHKAKIQRHHPSMVGFSRQQGRHEQPWRSDWTDLSQIQPPKPRPWSTAGFHRNNDQRNATKHLKNHHNRLKISEVNATQQFVNALALPECFACWSNILFGISPSACQKGTKKSTHPPPQKTVWKDRKGHGRTIGSWGQFDYADLIHM